MLLQVTALVLAIIVQIQAQYPGGNNYYVTNQPSRCPSANSPCRLKFNMHNRNGGMVHSSSSHICSCNNLRDCPNDWSPSGRVVSRNLRSANMNVTLQMMFCTDVTPREICGAGDVSLEISGYLMIPNELENYYCRCDDDAPLYLMERRVQHGRFYHKYSCLSFWDTCSAASPCMTVRQHRTTYHCKCPSSMQCRANGIWNAAIAETQVYCSPR